MNSEAPKATLIEGACCNLLFAMLLVTVGCASQTSHQNGAHPRTREEASTKHQPIRGDVVSCSGQRIVDLAVSMQGCHADEVGTNLTVWPFALSRYLKKKGTGPHEYEPWCSEFVCWAYAAAGSPLASGRQGDWMLKGNERLRAWFMKNRRFVSRADPDWAVLVPQPGDYVRFENAAGGHSAIVRSVAGPDLHIVHGSSRSLVRLDTVKDFRNSKIIDGIGLRLAK